MGLAVHLIQQWVAPKSLSLFLSIDSIDKYEFDYF